MVVLLLAAIVVEVPTTDVGPVGGTAVVTVVGAVVTIGAI